MSSSPFLLRAATRADIEQIHCLERACFRENPYTVDQFRHYLRTPNGIFLVAERGKSVVGYVAGVVDHRFRPVTAKLDSIAVAPDQRGQGAGATLLRRFEELAVRGGCRAAVLQVSVRNRPAVLLYESFGYERGPGLPDYYGPGKNAVEMHKLLA